MEQDKTQDTAQEQQGGATYTVADMLQELRELRKQLEGTGHYILLPTNALMDRAEAYYSLYRADIGRLLEASGIDNDTTNAVLVDYVALLSGLPNVRLPLAKQRNVINAVKPWRLFFTERYGLNTLFAIYLYNVRTCKEYIGQFKLADGHVYKVTRHDENGKRWATREKMTIPVEEQKRDFLDTVTNRIVSGMFPLYALGYQWLRTHEVEYNGQMLGVVETSDFAGVEPERANKFFSSVEAFAGIDNYVNYYYLAKYAYKATPDELKEIDFPPVFKDAETAQAYAEQISLNRYQNLQNIAADVEKAITAETEQEREQARQEVITEPVAEPEPQDTVRIPETFALIGSRDVYVSADGTEKMAQGILPIQAVITDYMKRHNLTEQVTPRTVEKVIEGVNLLQRLHNVRPVEGYYTFETNLSEFSGLIGFDDANQTQKLEIMRALQILDGLYLAVWRSEGLKAVRVFTIQEIGMTGVYAGTLTLRVNADAMKGRPNLISYKDFDAIRKDAKGQAKNHFRYQILSKGQKEENALLNEVFGYDVKVKNIQSTGGTTEEITKAKRAITNHKGRDKKSIAKWFEEYKQNGWLDWYTYTKNGKGEYIYKWKRGNIPREQVPDEQ